MTTLAAAMLVVVLLTVACGSDDPADPTGRTWVLAEMGGQPPVEGSIVDLTITEGTIAGSAGCNTYTGGVTLAGSDFIVDTDVARTLMACEEPLMSQEDAYLTMLAAVTAFELDDDELRLLDDADTVVARFT